MASKTLDKWSQFAALTVTESAANTQTATKFAFPFSIMDKMALVICRIEYEWRVIASALTASNDMLSAALTASSTVTDIRDPTDPLIIDSIRTIRVDMGAAASGIYFTNPFVKDFTNLPGGGLLVAPNPLYLMIEGQSCAAAGSISVRLHYTYLALGTDEYWQLVESRRIISS